jgi:lysophospholipase L1-like esterase
MLGDSWAGGYAAQPARNGFIWLTGDHYDWNYTNYFMPGSGYLNDGANGAGTYLDRLADAPIAPDAQLVIIQGSVNDGGEKIELLTQAARDVIQKTRELYPAAQVVLVGPAPLALPVSPRTETMDTALRAAAAYEGAAYVSPIAEEWLTAENISQWIDPAAANHPTTAGHAYLADRLIGSLDALGSGQTE